MTRLDHLRANATIIAIIAVGIAAVAVITVFDPNRMLGSSGADPAADRPLCINGHPTRRLSDVTYGGLPPRHGVERDHRIPLGLGGPDTADNVFYQPCDRFEHGICVQGEAAHKDDLEWQTIQDMCAGRITPQAARALPYFQKRYWVSDGGSHR